LGRAADVFDDVANVSSKVALVSGAAALVTSETVVGGVVFGTIAVGAEAVSVVSTTAAAVANVADGNYRAAANSAFSLVVGAVIPWRANQFWKSIDDSPLGKDFSKYMGNTGAEFASHMGEFHICGP
jgi:hypothetical protein